MEGADLASLLVRSIVMDAMIHRIVTAPCKTAHMSDLRLDAPRLQRRASLLMYLLYLVALSGVATFLLGLHGGVWLVACFFSVAPCGLALGCAAVTIKTRLSILSQGIGWSCVALAALVLAVALFGQGLSPILNVLVALGLLVNAAPIPVIEREGL